MMFYWLAFFATFLLLTRGVIEEYKTDRDKISLVVQYFIALICSFCWFLVWLLFLVIMPIVEYKSKGLAELKYYYKGLFRFIIYGE